MSCLGAFRTILEENIQWMKYNDYLLLHFHCTFSQLIAWELHDRHEHGYLLKPYPPHYRRFLDLAEILGKTHRVHFHSLNHDLYMEGWPNRRAFGVRWTMDLKIWALLTLNECRIITVKIRCGCHVSSTNSKALSASINFMEALISFG